MILGRNVRKTDRYCDSKYLSVSSRIVRRTAWNLRSKSTRIRQQLLRMSEWNLRVGSPMFQAVIDKVLHVLEPLGGADVPMPALLNLGEDPRLDQRTTGDHYT